MLRLHDIFLFPWREKNLTFPERNVPDLVNQTVPDCPGCLAPDQLKENHQEIITKRLQFEKSYLQGGCLLPFRLLRQQMIVFRPIFFFVSNFLCFKGYFDQHRRQRNEKIPIPMFRPTVHVFLSYCFSLNSKLSQWRRFFCFVCFFFQSVFVLLYTKIKKNVERVHFLFPLPSVIYTKNAITWLFFFL